MVIYRFTFLFFALCLAGCQENVRSSQSVETRTESSATTADQQTSTERSDDTASAKNTNTRKNRVNKLTESEKITLRLLGQGESALLAQRLLTPAEDNANLYFQAALGRDPGNFRAIQGITAIVDRYTQWAWQAAQGRNYQAAERYLDSARSVNPEDPAVTEMSGRIKDLMQRRAESVTAAKITSGNNASTNAVEADSFFLPKSLFRQSEEEIIADIQPIIDKVSSTKQTIAIYWPNDKEARLIYQIINSRVTEFRVRAMIFHRADYAVKMVNE
ncbi:hypothetical protein [Marinomonas algarum]|uniref:Tetratricopeptide repeat protein n=1 Tax=Marinomonas algarum TaxID=2883105 RepID=A0A9X1IP39_9GAMM|nr:hypothetical protein [Marinomonas algarum]MCB5161333.1 hypothetical protein [Marinomonas algarum]